MTDFKPTSRKIQSLLKKIEECEQEVEGLRAKCKHDWITTYYGGDSTTEDWWKHIRCVKCGDWESVDQDDPLYRSTPIPEHVHNEVRKRPH